MEEIYVESLNATSLNATSLLGINIPFSGFVLLDIYLITLVVALFTTIITKYMTDQISIKALRKDLKDSQKKMREIMVKDPKKAQELQQKIMKKNFELMKHSMNIKMLLITMAPLLIVFTLVGRLYPSELFPVILNLGFVSFAWLGTYIIFSIINSIILKKVLDVA